MLDLEQLGAFLDHHHDRYRVQTRDRYDVASDGEDVRRFVAGEAEPTWSRKQLWLDHLRHLVDSGRQWRNVHALSVPLSSYLTYACEWGYAYNVTAGQDVRIVELPDGDVLRQLQEVDDFWVLDGVHVVQMAYDDAGRFVGAEVITDERTAVTYRAVAGLLWHEAEPFSAWWSARPQLHRSRVVT